MPFSTQQLIQQSIDRALARTTGRIGSPKTQSPRVTRTVRPTPRPTAPPTPQQVRQVASQPRPVKIAPEVPVIQESQFGNEAQRLINAGELSVLHNQARADLRAQPIVQKGIVNEAVRASLGGAAIRSSGGVVSPPTLPSPLQQAISAAPGTFGLQGAPPSIQTQEGASALAQGVQDRVTQAPQETRQQATSQAREPISGTVGTGNTLDRQLLNLAATDPERLRERARFINQSQDRGAQVDVGVALTAESMARGHFPDIMSDAVASRLSALYGYDSMEEMMADLGYIPNPDAPGTWLRQEPVSPGQFGTTGFGGSGSGGGGSGGFIPGTVPRATRGGGFSLGLTNWRI